jgi:hypothetical protein
MHIYKYISIYVYMDIYTYMYPYYIYYNTYISIYIYPYIYIWIYMYTHAHICGGCLRLGIWPEVYVEPDNEEPNMLFYPMRHPLVFRQRVT